MPELRTRVKIARPNIGVVAGRGPVAGVIALLDGHRVFAGFIVAGMLLGGAGRNYPLLEMALQLLALGVLASTMAGPDRRAWNRSVWQGPAGWACGLLCAAGAVMWLQLVPLPPDLWQTLPGHGIAAQIDTAIGWTIWRPLSLTPDATGAGVLALLPVLAALTGCLALGQAARQSLVVLLAGLALLMATLGLLQVAGLVDSLLFPFRTAHQGLGVGLFVNRNHQACFLLAAMPLAMAAARQVTGRGGREWRLVCTIAIAVMAMGVVATLSRTGLVLLPLVGLVVLAQGGALRDRTRQVLALLGAGGLAAVLWLSPALAMTLARFSSVAEDSRLDYWRNTLFALKDTLPWGTGIGSFRTVYATVEPLRQVQPLYVEHAHDDGLEVLLEAGWPGAALIAGLLAVVVIGFWRTRRDHAGDVARLSLAQAGVVALMVMVACSLGDYPLRMPAMGVMAGVCLALVLPSPERARVVGPDDGWRLWLGRAVAVLVAVPVVQAGVGQQLVLAGQSAMATLWAPWLSAGWSARAAEQQAAGDHGAAIASALRTLRIQPMNAQAVRVLGISREMTGNDAGAMAMMQTAAQLGWRDIPTQNWLIDQAVAHERYDVAVHGVDAVLRQGAAPQPYYALLRGMVARPPARSELVDALVENPGWRRGFFNALADDAVAQQPAIAQLLGDLARSGAGADSEETALLRWRLADAGDYAGVARLWTLAGGKGVIGHPTFDLPTGPLPAIAAPLTWRAPLLPGVSATVVQASDPGESGRHALRISSDGIASGAALVQTLALPVGTYGVTLELESRQGAQVLPDLALTCRSGAAQDRAQGPAQGLVSLHWGQGGAEHRVAKGSFTVSASCPGQDISVVLKASPAGQFSYSLQALRIDRASHSGASQ